MPSIPQFIAIPGTGPLVLVFEPIVAGSALEFSVFFEEETAPDSGVWEPMEFTGLTLVSEMRASVYDASPIVPGVGAVISATPGYIDFKMPASVSLANAGKTLKWGFKLVPADPEMARIRVVGDIEISYGGVR